PDQDPGRLQDPAAPPQGQRERHRALGGVLHRDGREVRPGLGAGASRRRLRVGPAEPPALRVGGAAGGDGASARRRADRPSLRQSGRRSADEEVGGDAQDAIGRAMTRTPCSSVSSTRSAAAGAPPGQSIAGAPEYQAVTSPWLTSTWTCWWP